MDDLSAASYALRLTRELLRSPNSEKMQHILSDFAMAIGMMPAELDAYNGIGIDVAVDARSPKLLTAPTPAIAAQAAKYLLPLVTDARYLNSIRANSQQLRKESRTDPLTGLWNRRATELALVHAKDGDCITMIDLDLFKLVNDTHGHDAGDQVLRLFANHLNAAFPPPHVVGRFGGEEFVVLHVDRTLAQAVAEVETARIAWEHNSPFGLTFSAGVVAVTHENDRRNIVNTYIKSADDNLYEAKRSGRNRVIAHAAQKGEAIP